MNFHFALLVLSINYFQPANPCVATSSATAATTTTTSAVTTTVATTTTALACATCTADLIGLVSGNEADVDATYVISTDSDGCLTITYTCSSTPVVSTDVVLITYYSDSATPTDVGTADGTGSVTATLTCVDGAWYNTNVEINDIECQVIT